MRHLKMFEKLNIKKTVYWMVPTDNRLEDSIVKIYKQYSNINNITNLIDISLELSNNIRENIKDDYVYIKMMFSVDENDNVIGDPSFGYFNINYRDYYDKEPYSYYVGTVNIEKYELDAIKYNL